MSAALELTVLGEIAKGGMGSVELARLEDTTGEHFVAVKRMHREYAADPEFVRMFRDEIWLMSALSHPNLVGLVGWGEDDEGPYLAMEYVDGVALGRIVNAGRRAFDPIPEKLVAHVAARSAEGLAAAHRLCDREGRPLSIVHRDVTPSNVLVGFDGCVKVTDFGIAKAAGKSSHTRTGIIKGKIAYMSPEYAARRPVDGRADLYSLGVVMFELLTGTLPFEAGSDYELLKLVAYSSAAPLASVSPEVDAKLASLVDRLLSKDPEKRHEDGTELAAALDCWLEEHGHGRAETEHDLAAYAERHAGYKRDFLKKLIEDDVDTEPDEGLRRPRLAMLKTRTFTFFEKPWAHEPPKDSTGESERPRTRRVAVSDFPPPNVPMSVPPPPEPAPPPAPTTPARGSVPPPASSTPARASVPPPASATPARASVPPPRPALGSTPGGEIVLPPVAAARARRAHSNAALGGVIIGAGIALALVLVTLAFSTPRVEPIEEAPRADHATPAVTSQPDVPPVTPTPSLGEQAAAPPSQSAAIKPVESAPVRTPAKRVPGKAPPPKKPAKPCTIDSFDYPACLSR